MLGAAEKMSPDERLPRPRKLGSSPGRTSKGGAGGGEGEQGGRAVARVRPTFASFCGLRCRVRLPTQGCMLAAAHRARTSQPWPHHPRQLIARTHNGALVPGHLAAVLVPHAVFVLHLRAPVVEHSIAQHLQRKGGEGRGRWAAVSAEWPPRAQGGGPSNSPGHTRCRPPPTRPALGACFTACFRVDAP